ncbi:acyl transferase domain-containing protein/acyl carrier protein [Pseudomonas frederiksbergensis]|uniref:type I polyketide synthase n=1 Tax=Pseudomonas frederiksbergensis TaxID=104087 RepID=UPI003D1CB267
MDQKPHEPGASAVKHALAAVRELKHALEQQTNEPVAIVGAGCRVPGASSLQAFWSLLLEQRDAIGPIPATRWHSDDLYDADPLAQGKVATRWAGVIDALAFDAGFFGISVEEALHMDPQQRVFLEVAYEALEQAGLTREKLRGSQTGVFAGVVNYNDGYARQMFEDLTRVNAFSGPGVSNSVLVGRLAYLFDLKGPCMAIDTACSSSLVAVHQACHSLRLKECEQAIVGGVNIILGPEFSVATSRMHLMAPDGRCKPFDERANGIVRSDGCGVVILKRLSDAQRDNDPILAVIHASAINQDGKTNGMTAPSGHSQEDLTRQVLAQAKLGPDDLGYVEAHGTGTKLGDPIEIAALDRVLASRRNVRPCLVGSVKANIGHCEAAAGIVSLIKTVLCLQQRCIPGQLHLETLNQHMEFDAGRIDFPRQATPWPENEGRLQYAGVSSFGWSGTNAQVLVGPAPLASQRSAPNDVSSIVTLSGATPQALRDAVQELTQSLAHLPASQELQLDDESLARRASPASFRKAFVAQNVGQLLTLLRQWLDGDEPVPGNGNGLALIFSGQGNQWPGMVDALLHDEPAFRESLFKCEAIIQKVAGWSLIKAIARQSDADLSRTELAQPCIVAIQVSMFEMLKSWGGKPTAVMGHSVGEFSAACCAGMLGLEETLTAVISRGRCMEALRDHGRMYAALAPAHVVRDLLGDRLDATISAINSPTATIISVTSQGADALVEAFAVADLELIPVNPHYPFHCPLMEPLTDELNQGFVHLQHRRPTLAFVSSSRDLPAQDEPLEVGYWLDNAILPVRFEQAVVSLAELGCDTFVEIGPHASLVQHIKGSLAQRQQAIRVMSTLNKNRSLAQCLTQLKVGLYESGQNLESNAFGQRPRRQWQHCDYGFPAMDRPVQASTGQLMGQIAKGMPRLALRTQWGAGLSPMLGDHCMFDKVVVPGAAHLCVLLSHGIKHLGMRAPQLSDVSFIRPLLMTREDTSAVSIELVRQSGSQSPYDFHIHVEGEGQEAALLSSGTLVESQGALADIDLAWLKRAIAESIELDVQAFYDKARVAGLQLGPMFRKIRQLWLSRDQRRLFLSLDAASGESRREGLVLEPGVLDSCFQALFAAYWQQLPEADLFIPLSVDQLVLAQPTDGPLWGVIELTSQRFDIDTEVLSGDLVLADEQGRGVVDLKHVQLKRARRAALLGSFNEVAGNLFQLGWCAMKAEPQPIAGQESFAVVGRTPYVDQLVAALEGLGHRVVISDRAQDVSEPVDHVLYLASSQEGGNETWIEKLVVEIEQLRLLVDRQDQRSAGARLSVLTRGIYDPGTDGESATLIGGASAAVTRVIAKEYPGIRCTTIDLPADAQELLGSLEKAARILASNSRDPALRIAGGEVQVRGVERLADNAHCAVKIDAQGHYLITGGFGETGQALMRQLVDSGGRYVTLMGRGRPSDTLIAQASHFKEEGVQVQLFQGDVCVFEDVAALMRSVQRSGRPLKGIYHLAGVVEDSLLTRLDPAALRRVLEPKVAGTWHLHQATEGMSLDWFIAFSSLSASIGIAGQSAYVAANAFMEGVMRRRQSNGLPGAAIGWGPWSAGMSARLDPAHLEQLRGMGLGLLSVDQVAAMAMGANVTAQPVSLVAEVSLPVLRGLLRQDVGQPSHTAAGSTSQASVISSLDESEKWEAMSQLLMEELAPVVSRSTLTLDTVLAELGLDSLTAVAIVQRIRQRTGRTLPISAFFDSPRLRDVVMKLLEHF